MAPPFEGLFGDSSELRIIQFMLPLKGLEFNISELARKTGVSRQTMNQVVKKLAKWSIIKITSKHGNANYYAINEDSSFIEAFENLNNCIIDQMLGEEMLARIANYSLEQSQGYVSEPPSGGYVRVLGRESLEKSWLYLTPESPEDRQERVASPDSPGTKIGLGVANVAA